MFVDVRKCPCIVDIQERIQQQCRNVTVTNLLLDGCVLPPDESCELLRDNDALHVEYVEIPFKEWSSESAHRSSTLSAKHRKRKRRKRKQRDDNGDSSVSECISIRTAEEAGDDLYASEPTEKKKSKKHKKEKRKREDSDASDDDSLCLANVAHSSKADKHSEKEIIKEKNTTKRGLIETEYKSGHQEIAGEGDELKDGSGSVKVTEPMLDNSSFADASAGEKKKRRRRKKKKTTQEDECKDDSTSGRNKAVINPSPAPLRLPKWNQPKSKKIVFSSDEDCAMMSVDNEANSVSGTIANAGSELASLTKGSSANEPFTSGTLQVAGAVNNAGDASCLGGDASVDLNNYSDMSSFTYEQSSEAINGEENLHTNQHYQGKGKDERRNKNKKSAAYAKSALPEQYHYTDHHQERGEQMPPYVKSRRLANGAMVYTRTPAYGEIDNSGTPPRELSKQKQLNTVCTNKSTIVQNISQPQTNGNNEGQSNQEPKRDNGEMVVTVTPLHRDYSLFPDLTAAPKVGDKIAYKVLELGENYAPGISDYKEAEVLGYEATSQVVTIKVLQTEFSSGKKTPGRFDLPEGEGEEEEIEIELSSMFEPKLMTSS
ncbi:coilin-like isoform X2 [Littorina saxatilis]|uniref:coilin-like isoform X2 n=1 Tax=Littorina saxatilis TaxID=31220 RepID=UPI0038B63C33